MNYCQSSRRLEKKLFRIYFNVFSSILTLLAPVAYLYTYTVGSIPILNSFRSKILTNKSLKFIARELIMEWKAHYMSSRKRKPSARKKCRLLFGRLYTYAQKSNVPMNRLWLTLKFFAFWLNFPRKTLETQSDSEKFCFAKHSKQTPSRHKNKV